MKRLTKTTPVNTVALRRQHRGRGRRAPRVSFLARVLVPHRFLLVVLALAALSLCRRAGASYPEEIAAWRAEKDAFMREPASRRSRRTSASTFPPLPYYPIDEQYRVPAGLKMVESDQIIELSPSTGQTRQMRRIGTLAFTLKGQPLSLTAFADVGDSD